MLVRFSLLLLLFALVACGTSSEPAEVPTAQDVAESDASEPDTQVLPDVPTSVKWGYINGTDCPNSWQCSLYGFCRQEGERCVVGSDEDCAQSAYCTLNGGCVRVGDWCGPTTDEHCAQSKLCQAVIDGCGMVGDCCGYCEGGATEPGPDDYSGLPSDLTWSTGIQDIIQVWCGACHNGPTATDCPGDSCLATFYEAAVAPSEHHLCMGETKLGCGLVRADFTLDPDHEEALIVDDGRLILLPPPLAAALRGWLERGAPF